MANPTPMYQVTVILYYGAGYGIAARLPLVFELFTIRGFLHGGGGVLGSGLVSGRYGLG